MKADLKKIGVTVIETFISHMVQMKGREPYDLGKPVIPLYPTWFRWKAAAFRLKPSAFYFISHMVQMKAIVKDGLFNAALTLYPTWFRWKLILLLVLKVPSLSLYPTWFRWKTVKY